MAVIENKPRFDILDILIEFKFVRLKDAGLTGEEARKLDRGGLGSLTQMGGGGYSSALSSNEIVALCVFKFLMPRFPKTATKYSQ